MISNLVFCVGVGHPNICTTTKCLLGLFDRSCGCLVFSNYMSPIRSTLSFNINSHSLLLSQPVIFISLSQPRPYFVCLFPSASSFLIFSLLFTSLEDTLWGIYYVHESARIQFYSFDETVRNLPLNFLHLTFS